MFSPYDVFKNVIKNRTKDNKTFFVDRKRKKKAFEVCQNFFSVFIKHPFLHVFKIQEDLPVNTNYIKPRCCLLTKIFA